VDEKLVVDQRIGIDDADGIAVRRGILAGSRADILHAAGAIFDHDRMAEPLAQLFAERTHEDVADAAGARGGERPDRPRRPLLRARGKAHRDKGYDNSDPTQINASHGNSPWRCNHAITVCAMRSRSTDLALS